MLVLVLAVMGSMSSGLKEAGVALDDLQYESALEKLPPEGARAGASRAELVEWFAVRGLAQLGLKRDAAATETFLQLFSSAMAQYISETGIACSVIDFVDVDSDKWSQYASTKVWPQKWVYQREADLLLKYEIYVTKKCSYATFVSEKEAGLFKQLSPEVENKITYFNNGVDTEYFSPSQNFANPYKPGTKVLVFTGAMDYWPNVDAVRWFAAELFPAIRTKIPDLEFYIVGARPTKTVLELSAIPGVVVTGSVDDVRHLFSILGNCNCATSDSTRDSKQSA